jgi:catechol 2,3-dioxygenase-like lactoylglutathione lyase family enzyme
MKNEETPVPILHQINLVVKNIPASIAFYRRLGLTVEEAGHPEWAAHHATAVMSNGMRLEFDSESFAKQWNSGWRDRNAGSLGVLFFAVPTREDVDRLHASLSAFSCSSQQLPCDAFWGSRYAIIEDPDGNSIGIMSPIDPAYRRTPPPPPS